MMQALLAIALVVAAPVKPPLPPSGDLVSREMTQAELKDQIDLFLRVIDAPVEPARWQALGNRAVPVLEEIARDRSELPTRRSQALSALGWIGGTRASAVLAELSTCEEEHASVRMAAVRGLAVTGSAGTLRALLEHAGDARVRAVAAEQIAARADGECAAVRARAGAEDATLRPLFAKALASCAGR